MSQTSACEAPLAIGVGMLCVGSWGRSICSMQPVAPAGIFANETTDLMVLEFGPPSRWSWKSELFCGSFGVALLSLLMLETLAVAHARGESSPTGVGIAHAMAERERRRKRP